MNLSFLGSPLLHTSDAPSLQRQLIQRLKQSILNGQLPAHTKIPSSRALAEELHISRNTVLIAYEQLTAEGYIIADRKGSRVSSISSHSMNCVSSPRSENISNHTQRLTHITPSSPFTEDKILPLTIGLPALNHFPIHAWKKAQEHALQAAPSTFLGYGDPLGEPELRESIAQHVRLSRGVRCEASEVIITEGAQGALALCVKLLTRPHDIAWLENPGYRGAKTAFYEGDLNIIGMPVDQNGIVIPPEAWLKHPPRLIQTTPSHQYPIGSVLSLARRLDLIEQANRLGSWIIEDDYDSDFRHQGEPIAAMQGLFPNAPVLYVGTFSKTMFPALRLGFLILPAQLASLLTPIIREILRGGHRLEQLAMATFMKNGQFSRHLGRMRRLYRERQSALRNALGTHFNVTHEISGGNSGLHLTIRLPTHYPDQIIAEKARSVGMNPRALSSFSLTHQTADNGLVIGYGNTAPESFIPLIKKLAQIANQTRIP